MRSKYAAMNGLIGISLFFITMIFGFIRRSALINQLGPDYVGITALFGDLLMLLNMADIGLSGAIGAVLYKPLVEGNYAKINGIIQYYKKIYRIAGSVFIIFSVIAVFAIGFLINSPHITDNQIRFYFVLSAANVAITYFWSYRLILITTDQKLYYLNTITTVAKTSAILVQIILLMFIDSFTVYLTIDIAGTILYIIILNIIIRKKFSILKNKEAVIEQETKTEIVKSLKGLVYHKLGTVSVYGTNYLYTTMFAGLTQTAIYSNYQLMIRVVEGIINNFFTALTSTIGNLLASEGDEKVYSLFKVLFLINFWLVSLAAIIFYNSSSAFISLWVGKKYIISDTTLVLFTAYIFVMYIRPSTEQFKFAAGIFYEDRFIPIIEAILNLIACLALGYYFGMTGIIAGNLISTLLVISWQKPYMVFKYVFKRSLKEYFKVLIPYIILCIFALVVSNWVCSLLNLPFNLFGFVGYVVATVLVVNVIYLAVFWKTRVFSELRNYGKSLFMILKAKFSR